MITPWDSFRYVAWIGLGATIFISGIYLLELIRKTIELKYRDIKRQSERIEAENERLRWQVNSMTSEIAKLKAIEAKKE